MQPRRPDRELVGLGPEQATLDADPVAEVQQLVDREVELGQRVLPDVRLDLRAAVGQDQEIGFAERADREDAAARDRRDVLALELVVRPLAVGVDQLGDRVLPFAGPRIDLDAELVELREVLLALLNLFVV
jgi:hypothetical protein